MKARKKAEEARSHTESSPSATALATRRMNAAPPVAMSMVRPPHQRRHERMVPTMRPRKKRRSVATANFFE